MTQILASSGSGSLRFFLTDPFLGSDVDYNTLRKYLSLTKTKCLENNKTPLTIDDQISSVFYSFYLVFASNIPKLSFRTDSNLMSVPDPVIELTKTF